MIHLTELKTMTGVPQDDPVNHPAHYTYGGIECIDYIFALGFGEDFCKGNAIKYISRAGHKADKAEDLKKAVWYLTRLISHLEGGDSA